MMTTERKTKRYVSAVERLRALPPVLTIRDLQGSGVGRDAATKWRKRGYLMAVGKKTGVYYNLIADPQAEKRYLAEAGLLSLTSGSSSGRWNAYPVVLGNAALSDHGWGRLSHAPIFERIDVAVLAGRKLNLPDDVEDVLHLCPRPSEWYAWYQQATIGLLPPEYGFTQVPCASPVVAVVDSRLSRLGEYAEASVLDESIITTPPKEDRIAEEILAYRAYVTEVTDDIGGPGM